ncbi:MAG: sigma-70 family RNA polymerase sigma factor [Xanthomonadales bacterium]|nr:sigma-70 family RNA polymerase sigma factor [Xanthomonadales bacterium]
MNPPFAHDHDTEQTWLAQARAGDHAAFAALYLRHSAAVFTLALRLSGCRSQAEDLTQETFLRALRGLAGFRDGAALGPWLKRITANLAIDQQRRERPTVELDEIPELPADGDDRGRALDLAAVMAELPPMTRSVLWLVLMEGWSHKELAERYGRSESWSKSLLSRAVARLKLNAEVFE